MLYPWQTGRWEELSMNPLTPSILNRIPRAPGSPEAVRSHPPPPRPGHPQDQRAELSPSAELPILPPAATTCLGELCAHFTEGSSEAMLTSLAPPDSPPSGAHPCLPRQPVPQVRARAAALQMEREEPLTVPLRRVQVGFRFRLSFCRRKAAGTGGTSHRRGHPEVRQA